jgi:hypothetical protein
VVSALAALVGEAAAMAASLVNAGTSPVFAMHADAESGAVTGAKPVKNALSAAASGLLARPVSSASSVSGSALTRGSRPAALEVCVSLLGAALATALCSSASSVAKSACAASLVLAAAEASATDGEAPLAGRGPKEEGPARVVARMSIAQDFARVVPVEG